VAAFATALAAASVLAACGGGGSGSNDSEKEINSALTTFFTTADPSQCDLLTQKALEQVAPSVARADDPAAACREEVKASAGQTAKSIDADIDVDGPSAKATVTPDGGIFAGLSVDVALVDDDGWKIDGLGQSHLVDADTYLSALEIGAGQGQLGNGAITPKDAHCMAGRIKKTVPDSDLARYIEQDNKDFFYDAIKFCMGAGQDFIAVVALASNQLRAAGLPPDKADCIAGLTLAGPKNLTVKQFAEDSELKQKLENTIRNGAFMCDPNAPAEKVPKG
jgi:hypothetical protein